MLKHITVAALLIVSFAVIAQAQAPDLPLIPADTDPASLAETPIMSQPQSVTADTVVTHDMVAGSVMGDCGCQSPAACTHCGPTGQRPTWKEKCAYYRSVRQGFDRGPCCADYFGGFGPLWDTYCADKQRCGSTSCASNASCQSCTVRPRLQVRHRRVRSQCDSCGGAGTTCDCMGSGQALPSDAQFDIGQPPQPVQPTPADTPSPATPQLDTSAAVPPKAASARRSSWPSRTVGWRRK